MGLMLYNFCDELFQIETIQTPVVWPAVVTAFAIFLRGRDMQRVGRRKTRLMIVQAGHAPRFCCQEHPAALHERLELGRAPLRRSCGDAALERRHYGFQLRHHHDVETQDSPIRSDNHAGREFHSIGPSRLSLGIMQHPALDRMFREPRDQ